MKAEKGICHPKNGSYLICDLSLLIRCTVYWMTKHGVLNHILDVTNIFSFSLSLNWLFTQSRRHVHTFLIWLDFVNSSKFCAFQKPFSCSVIFFKKVSNFYENTQHISFFSF